MEYKTQSTVNKKRQPQLLEAVLLVRREGDSNPRFPFEEHTLSRRAR